ncbi:hypothetical protein Z043_121568, partial [Scleropages formosus]
SSYVVRKIRASIAEKEQAEEGEGKVFTPCSRSKDKAKVPLGSEPPAAMLTSGPEGATAAPSTETAVQKCGT